MPERANNAQHRATTKLGNKRVWNVLVSTMPRSFSSFCRSSAHCTNKNTNNKGELSQDSRERVAADSEAQHLGRENTGAVNSP